MSDTYGHIPYSMPASSAATYAAQALEVLQTLHAAAPRTLPVFLSANTVLTLSGVRAYDAYHQFYSFLTDEERGSAAKVLQMFGLRMVASPQSFKGEDELANGFELIHDGSLSAVWSMYPMEGSELMSELVLPDMPYDGDHLLAWSYVAEQYLARLMREGVLPREWLADWMSPHDLRFGMLLGYPAKALESFMWDNAKTEDQPSTLVNAFIAYKDVYFAAQPTYSYDTSLKGDPEIQAHKQLWSGILTAVYESDWHMSLRDDAQFQEVCAKIKEIETRA